MKQPDILIIGGGLAGLTAAIQLSKYGFKVKLFEKESYPHHKVCGEYVSNEILPYLNSLGVSLNSLNPPQIKRLIYSTPSGKSIETKLPLGAIGISRYALDNFLFEKAKENGVEIIQTTVTTVHFENDCFYVEAINNKKFTSPIVLGAFGKRSLLDKKLNREFSMQKSGWLAVKAHYTSQSFPEDVVALHNFQGGYCGISKTETENLNVCYLATYNSFKKWKNPEAFKKNVLCKNPHLKKFFSTAEMVFEKELTIAQISFSKKSLIQDHVIMLGDAAALIHPLCGNGMAMAIESAKIASENILKQLSEEKFNRESLEANYQKEWRKKFSIRLSTGRILQKILLNPGMAEIGQGIIKNFPSILPVIISKTHGQPTYE